MSTLLEALDAATEKDLEAVDSQILDYGKRLESLRAVRKVLEARLGKKPEAKGASPPRGEGDAPAQPRGAITKEYRVKVAKYLIARGGSGRVKELSEVCGVPKGSMGGVLDHPWFTRTEDGVYVTPQCRQEIG